MPPKVQKLIAYFPNSKPIEFDGEDVAVYGHDPETGQNMFGIRLRGEPPIDTTGRPYGKGSQLPDVLDIYYSIPFMIRQQKDISRIEVPNPSDRNILKV